LRCGGAGEIDDDIEWCERVCYRVGDGRKGGDRAGLAAAFDAERVGMQRVPLKPRSNEGRSSARGMA
jgi:hypothetical protein